MKIASDIDKLMWVLAESGDRSAIDDFESRFPDLKFELAKRVAMLRNLRGAKPAVAASIRPAFQPRASNGSVSLRKPWAVGGMLLGFAALAAASYYVTSMAMAPRAPKTQPAYNPPRVVVQPQPQVA